MAMTPGQPAASRPGPTSLSSLSRALGCESTEFPSFQGKTRGFGTLELSSTPLVTSKGNHGAATGERIHFWSLSGDPALPAALAHEVLEEELNCTQFSKSTLDEMAFTKGDTPSLQEAHKKDVSPPQWSWERQEVGTENLTQPHGLCVPSFQEIITFSSCPIPPSFWARARGHPSGSLRPVALPTVGHRTSQILHSLPLHLHKPWGHFIINIHLLETSEAKIPR